MLTMLPKNKKSIIMSILHMQKLVVGTFGRQKILSRCPVVRTLFFTQIATVVVLIFKQMWL